MAVIAMAVVAMSAIVVWQSSVKLLEGEGGRKKRAKVGLEDFIV